MNIKKYRDSNLAQLEMAGDEWLINLFQSLKIETNQKRHKLFQVSYELAQATFGINSLDFEESFMDTIIDLKEMIE